MVIIMRWANVCRANASFGNGIRLIGDADPQRSRAAIGLHRRHRGQTNYFVPECHSWCDARAREPHGEETQHRQLQTVAVDAVCRQKEEATVGQAALPCKGCKLLRRFVA